MPGIAVSMSTLVPLTPDFLSVTRHFYEQGWSGINVEPTFRFYPLLCETRPRDINLQCAIANSPGLATFYEIPKFAENSTLERSVADRLTVADLTDAARGRGRSIGRPLRSSCQRAND